MMAIVKNFCRGLYMLALGVALLCGLLYCLFDRGWSSGVRLGRDLFDWLDAE